MFCGKVPEKLIAGHYNLKAISRNKQPMILRLQISYASVIQAGPMMEEYVGYGLFAATERQMVLQPRISLKYMVNKQVI